MKPTIKKQLIKALRSNKWLLNLKDKDAPLCEILPNGDHRFSPAGVLCDLAPKEVADWVFWEAYMPVFRAIDTDGFQWFNHLPDSVDAWAGTRTLCGYPPINGHRTLAATIKAIEEM